MVSNLPDSLRFEVEALRLLEKLFSLKPAVNGPQSDEFVTAFQEDIVAIERALREAAAMALDEARTQWIELRGSTGSASIVSTFWNRVDEWIKSLRSEGTKEGK